MSDLRKQTPQHLKKKNFSLDSSCNLIESKEQSQFLQRHLIKSVLNKNNNNIQSSKETSKPRSELINEFNFFERQIEFKQTNKVEIVKVKKK